MKWLTRLAALGAVAGLLVGCAPLPATALPVATAPPTATSTPTATPVWFPPTATPTPLPPTPIPTPTPALAAGAGAPLLPAPFDNGAGWFSPTGYAGRFGVAGGVLSLSTTRPRATMLVLAREIQAFNLYLSVVAEPQACRGNDAYGVVVRASANGGRYYRLGLTCNGQAFVETVEGGLPVPRVTPEPAAVPPGAPVQATLSVRAAGQTLDFAVNGQVLFTVRDDLPPYGRGLMGFFARAASEEGMIVTFRDLTVRPVLPPP